MDLTQFTRVEINLAEFTRAEINVAELTRAELYFAEFSRAKEFGSISGGEECRKAEGNHGEFSWPRFQGRGAYTLYNDTRTAHELHACGPYML